MKTKRLHLALIAITYSILFFCVPVFAQTKCSLPPFVGTSPMPNVLISFDNSGSMYDLAYRSPTTINGSNYQLCYDNQYDGARTYYGYYDSIKWYEYNSTETDFQATEDSHTTCSNNTDLTAYCINVTGPQYFFSGNFLNWMTMSKFDLIKKALTGGKYAADHLIGESRGCVGRRLIKEPPNKQFIFAVRGSNPFGYGYDQSYSGGTTRIEVFDNRDDKLKLASCFQVAVDVMSDPVNQGQLKTDTSNCLTATGSGAAQVAFNHAMHSCWYCGKQENCTPADRENDVVNIYDECSKVLFDNKSPICTGNGCDWAKLNIHSDAYVCTSISHEEPVDKEKGPGPGTGDNATNPLYYGDCYATCKNFTINKNSLTDTGNKPCYDCVSLALDNYCKTYTSAPVLDPSSVADDSEQYGNIPAVILDSSIPAQLGDPIAILLNSIETDAPTGLLHTFAGKIKMGLMAFSGYGSGFEFTDDNRTHYFYDNSTTDFDGSTILTPVSDIMEPSGEINQSIINSLNGIEAYSWTPLAESLYEATRYFGDLSSAYNATISAYDGPIDNWCDKNYILLFSDGSSTVDLNLPGHPGSSLPEDRGFSVDNTIYLPSITYYSYKGSNYAVGVAKWMADNSTDLNPSFPFKQKVTIVPIAALSDSIGTEVLNGIAAAGWGSTILINNADTLYNQLRDAFIAILNKSGGAGAVATVTQQVMGEDHIVRGAFSTGQSISLGTTFWKGHLELYLPFKGCQNFDEADCNTTAGCKWEAGTQECDGSIYSFQNTTDKFCTGNHCWDSGTILSKKARPTVDSNPTRCVFTWLQNAQTLFGGPSADCPAGMGVTDNSSGILSAIANDIDFDADGNATESAESSNLVLWVRGNTFFDNSTGHDRDKWLLGDIVYSTPVVVEKPSLASVPAPVARKSCKDDNSKENCFFSYRSFYNTNRDKMVYVGSNDGMLHAFILGEWSTTDKQWHFDNETTWDSDADKVGDELWAYIPSNLLSELRDIARLTYGGACPHRTTVDLSPQVWDVYTATAANNVPRWRTLLLGGERSGGDVYFGLDVTDPMTAFPLWEYSVLKDYPAPESVNATAKFTRLYSSLKTLPLSVSLPIVGKIRNAGSDAYVAFFGGGIHDYQPQFISLPDNGTLKDTLAQQYPYLYYPVFHALNVEDGTDLWKSNWQTLLERADYQTYFAVDTTQNHIVPYALSHVAPLDVMDGSGFSITSGGTQDSYTDVIFAGDLQGIFYKLKLTTPDNVTGTTSIPCIVTNKTKIIHDANSNPYRGLRQPISVMPIAATDEDGNLRVFFGTGKFENVTVEPQDDQSDNATMSFYCYKEDIRDGISCPDEDVVVAATAQSPPIIEQCEDNGTEAHHFVKKVGAQYLPDGNSCFPCILDLVYPGERLVDSALVAAGYVFFTTFIPSDDPCEAGGTALLYIVDYMCRPLKDNPLRNYDPNKYKVEFYNLGDAGSGWEGTAGENKAAVRVELGHGMPSRPVLDSSGTSLIIQNSDGSLHRIGTDLGPLSKVRVLGWSTEGN